MSRATFTSLSVIFLREYSGVRKLDHAERRDLVPRHEQTSARAHSFECAAGVPYQLLVQQNAATVGFPVQPSRSREHPDNLVAALRLYSADDPLSSACQAAEEPIPGIPRPTARPNFAREPTFHTWPPVSPTRDSLTTDTLVEAREHRDSGCAERRSTDASRNAKSQANRDAQRGQLGKGIESLCGSCALLSQHDRQQVPSSPQVEERPSDRARQDGRPNLAQCTTNP